METLGWVERVEAALVTGMPDFGPVRFLRWGCSFCC